MASTAPLVPPLLPGQRLTREDFLARWDALPELKNAELIDGIVYMASPVSRPHAHADFVVHSWLGSYALATDGCRGGTNETWFMLESAPQPDVELHILPEYGGRSSMQGNYASGAPELAVEICASSGTHDFGAKLALYQRAGVQEYVTVATDPAEVIWRELVDGRYVALVPGDDAILRSRVFPGLWLDPAALLRADNPRLLEVLRQGLATPEHAAFVERLRATAAGSRTR